MTTALVRQELTPDVWNMIERIAPTMKESKFFDVATVTQAAAIMLKGHELGLGLTQSFEFIHLILNKPTISPRGALALILQSGELEGLKITDEVDDKGNPTACTVWMKRKGGIEYTSRFTMQDAARAKLTGSSGMWEKYPANMLKWRSVGYCADVVFPDVIGGMKRSDEFGADLTPDGNVIDATWTQTPPSAHVTDVTTPITQVAQPAMSTATPIAPAAVDPSTLLNELVQKFGAEKVLIANKEKIPTTLEELTKVKAELDKNLEFTLADVGELAH